MFGKFFGEVFGGEPGSSGKEGESEISCCDLSGVKEGEIVVFHTRSKNTYTISDVESGGKVFKLTNKGTGEVRSCSSAEFDKPAVVSVGESFFYSMLNEKRQLFKPNTTVVDKIEPVRAS